MVKISAVLYAVALGIVLFWAGWSVKKHGWVRRSLRRFSYLIFVALLTSRLSWCVWVLVQLHAQPADCLEENCGVIALRSATAVALSHTAFCLWFLVFSMLVCGWADSTYMMMSGRSLQPTQVTKSTIFYHLGKSFLAVNVLNTACSIGTILPLLWHVLSTGHDVPGEDRLHAVLTADAADAADGDTLSVDALWFGRLSRGLFSLMLALSSTAAGIAVSCKIRDIATVEPALRSYAHAKMVKVALAAAVFCLCSLARSYVSLRLLLWEHAPPLTPFVALTYGIVVPELLPTFAALLVLRRRSCSPNCCASPRSCCTGVSSFAGVGEGGGIGMMARALWRCIWHTAMCTCCLDRAVAGVDPRPLRAAEDGP